MAQSDARSDVIDAVLAMMKERLDAQLPGEDATLDEIEETAARVGADVRRELVQRCAARAQEARPEWVRAMDERFDTLLALPVNWDSYGARRPDPDIMRSARECLLAVARRETPPPIIVPTVRGGIQVEWHSAGIDLEIEISTPGRFEILYENTCACAAVSLDRR